MGDIGENHHGVIRYTVPADSPPAEERSLYGLPRNESYKDVELEIRNFNASEELVKGGQGLDTQGFTYVEHHSKLAEGNKWYEGSNIEDVYFQEMRDLVCSVTGASRAAVLNTGIRQKAPTLSKDPDFYLKKGCDFDVEAGKSRRDIVPIVGRETAVVEPVRAAHVDYTLQGLRNSLRYVFKDVRDMGIEAIKAEDAAKNGETARTPRYAAYSVWRPIKTIKRDGLAVCDWRTMDKDEIKSFAYRARSEVNESGEFLLEGYNLTPPNDPTKQRWYHIPNQQPHEVLFIKLADTESEKDSSVAGGAGHCSPAVKGEESEEVRESIESRMIAFWD